MGSRLNMQGPGGLHGLQAGEEVRTFFCVGGWNPLGSTRSPCGSNVSVGRAPTGSGERTDGFENHECATRKWRVLGLREWSEQWPVTCERVKPVS